MSLESFIKEIVIAYNNLPEEIKTKVSLFNSDPQIYGDEEELHEEYEIFIQKKANYFCKVHDIFFKLKNVK
jgi:hypothetical protein